MMLIMQRLSLNLQNRQGWTEKQLIEKLSNRQQKKHTQCSLITAHLGQMAYGMRLEILFLTLSSIIHRLIKNTQNTLNRSDLKMEKVDLFRAEII
jgi:hypothetical protein